MKSIYNDYGLHLQLAACLSEGYTRNQVIDRFEELGLSFDETVEFLGRKKVQFLPRLIDPTQLTEERRQELLKLSLKED